MLEVEMNNMYINIGANNGSEKLWKKNRAPSSILHEAKIAYYARNMFEAARLVFP